MLPHLPISPSAFARSWQHSFPSFSTHTSKIAVAVSGGPDSIALLYLLRRRLRDNLNEDVSSLTDRLVTVTVDHGFRSESRQEALSVADFSRSLGVSHTTLTIPWSQSPFPSKPTGNSRTELIARNARLSLFRRFMAQEGINTICMGHHRGDQVENLLLWGKVMKSLSGLPRSDFDDGYYDGFAGGLRILRPLLGFDKSELLATCHAHNLPYFIDPTNLDKSYTPRNALRQELEEFQTRHQILPPRIPSLLPTPGGPLALLHRQVLKSTQINTSPLPLPLSAKQARRNFLNYHITPSEFNPATPPAKIRSQLRSLIDHISPRTTRRISELNLERTRQILFGEIPISGEGKEESFTPGGGVMIRRHRQAGTRGDWIISRQPFRAVDCFGRAELRIGEGWIEWDGRICIRVIALSEEAKDWRWFVEGRGRSSFPCLVRRGMDGKEEVVLQLRGDGDLKEGSWSDDIIRLEWLIETKKTCET